MRYLDLYPGPVESSDENNRTRINIDFKRSYDEDLKLWYSVPHDQWKYVSRDLMDPFVLAALLKAMEDRATLRVHGPVSTSLLDNLEEFQIIFSTWFPDKYYPIDIVADDEREETPCNNQVILSFSGGVDGAFSALNHILRKGPIKRKLLDVNAILYIEGFDVNINYDEQCRNVVERNRKLFGSYPHLTFLNVRTNLKYLLSIKRFWMAHACVIASVASLFRTMWGGCLIGSSHSYLHLRPWGSHPLTDRLLSSNSFKIHHDTVFTRMEKLEALFSWPEALENLKVCWEGQYKFDTLPDTNCCQCDKCVRTMLAFKALGRDIPASFPGELTIEKVQGLKNKPFDWSRLMFLNEVLDTVKKRGLEKMPIFETLAEITHEYNPKIMQSTKTGMIEKMKVAYVYPPLFKPFYPMATRIMTENLLRNKNLEVQFSHIPVKTYDSNKDKVLYDGIMEKAASRFSSNVISFLEQKYMVYNVFYVFMAHGYYDAFIREDFEAEHIIFTCINFCDLLIVRTLLENGKKVILGGPLINIGLSPAFLRQFLSHMGAEKSKLRDNLIVISGNVDLTTDLYQIIKNWKDGQITENDYGSIFECRRDFLTPHYQGKAEIPVHLGFNNWCWYGKCKFCTYKELPRMDFLKNLEIQSAVDAIHGIMQGFNSRHIRFIDSYYRPHSPVVQEILQQISQYHITIFTGITLLKDKQYIEFINKYVNCLLIGLESTSDFTLKHVAKGYLYRDIEQAVENMIQYLDRSIFLEISVILDLPYGDADNIRDNYRRIATLKDRLDEAGFRVAVHMNILSVFPNLELLYTEDAMLNRSFDSKDMASSTGKNYLIHVLKQSGMDQPSQLPSGTVLVDENNAYGLRYGYISSNVPVVRHDVNGKILLSDLEIMEEDIMKRILLRKKRFQKEA